MSNENRSFQKFKTVILRILDFLASAFTNLIALNVSIIPFIYLEANPDKITEIHCKIEIYVMTVSLQMSRFFVMMACFDRYAMSSANAFIRKFSNVHIARYYVIPTIVVIWLLVPLHIPLFVTVEDHVCRFKGMLELYHSIYGIIFTGLIPPVLMSVFSALIFRNLKLRRIRRQIYPLTTITTNTDVTNGNDQVKKRDQQAVMMLLIQVIAYVISSTPYTLMLFYIVLTSKHQSINHTNENHSLILFIQFIMDMLRFFCPFTSFYLFVLASRLYRQEMLVIVSIIYRRLGLTRFKDFEFRQTEQSTNQQTIDRRRLTDKRTAINQSLN